MYFLGGISWWGKTPGVAWSAADAKVCYRHTKNLCVDTLFEDDEGVVYRVTETRAGSANGNVSYCDHFLYLDTTPPERHQFESEHDEVKQWHDASRAILAQREDLQPPTAMQDSYREDTANILRYSIHTATQSPTLTTPSHTHTH